MVVTGIGPATALGPGVGSFWDGLMAGRTAIGPVRAFDPSGFPAQHAAELPPYDIREWVPKSYRKATKVMARDTELAVIAAKLAAEDAGLRTRGSEEGSAGFAINLKRMGCMIGAGLIAAETKELTQALVTSVDERGRFSYRKWGAVSDAAEVGAFERSVGAGGGAPAGGAATLEAVAVGQNAMGNLPPLWMLKYLPNMLACHVTIIHGAEGPSNTHTCGEASGLVSIGEAVRVIQRGDAEACFAGGAENKVSLMGFLRWDMAGRAAHTRGLVQTLGREPDGREVVRPFEAASMGSVLGEAGGLVIVEEASHAASRNARVYARVLGFGAGQSPGSARHGPRIGQAAEPGLVRAIRAAMRDARITPADLDAVVPQGRGVPAEDGAEFASLREALGERADTLPMVLLTPSIGHSVAGQGGLQAAAGALALAHQALPALARSRSGGPCGGPRRLDRVLVCGSALGGQAAAIVLGR